jgi:RecB family exonuclease
MMTQLQTFTLDEQAIAQLEFEQYVQGQARAVTPEKGVYSVRSFAARNFLPDADNQNTPVLNQSTSQTEANREPLKHLLIGSSKAVTSTIHYLQVIGYADVGDWSPLLPSPNPGEVMSILNRPIVVK